LISAGRRMVHILLLVRVILSTVIRLLILERIAIVVIRLLLRYVDALELFSALSSQEFLYRDPKLSC
jgi:hypothetical protein